MRKFLDLRKSTETGLSLEQRAALAKFDKKSEAAKFARVHGWLASDAQLATTHVQAWWIVCQCSGDTVRALNSDGTVAEFHFAGFV